jgi:hypothetical protein
MTVKRLYKLGFIDAPERDFQTMFSEGSPRGEEVELNERGKALQAALLRNEGIKAEIARREALGAAK